MRRGRRSIRLAVAAIAVATLARPAAAPQPLGPFSGNQDIGAPSTIGAGSATYDSRTQSYVVSGGGANMWGTADQFHYVWREIYMHIGREGAPLKEIAHTEVSFQGPVLVGLVVCSHDAGASDTVVFSDVSVDAQTTAPSAK